MLNDHYNPNAISTGSSFYLTTIIFCSPPCIWARHWMGYV